MDRPAAWLRLWWPAVLLGLATIGSYGVATYAIGVLIAPIARDTGWGIGTVSAAYAAGVLGSGAVAVFAGRALDRVGSRAMFLSTLLGGSGLLLAASWQAHPLAFVATWAAGSAAIGGGWYYQATMPAAARIYREDPAAALSILTLLGALASPIFYPIAGVLAEAFGWREALRALVLLMLLLALPAAAWVNSPPSTAAGARLGLAEGVRGALARSAVWRAMLAIALTAAATNAIILLQVPAMEAAGLSIAAASGYGGARGAMQIPARLILRPLVRGIGVPRAVLLAYGTLVAAAGMLLGALTLGGVAVGGEHAFAALFAATAGFSVGLLSPLHGLLAVEVYGDRQLGTLSGVQQLGAAVAGASAPWLAGLAVDATGGYEASLAGVALLQLGAVAAFVWHRRAVAAEAASTQEAATPEAERPVPARTLDG